MITFKNSLFVLTLLSTIGCALMAGVFFAFSTFVMRGLNRLPANEAISAMQSINGVVPGSVFGATFVITPAICLLTMILAVYQWNGANGFYIIAGGIIYLVTNVVVTFAFNIPLNDALALTAPNAADGANVWSDYQAAWTMWNHVRTIGAIISTVSFVFALLH